MIERIFNSIAVEPTNMCNIRCDGCQRDRKGNKILQPNEFKMMLEKLKGLTSKISFFWQGEPTISAHLPDIVRLAKEDGIYTYVSTNMSTKNLQNKDYVKRLLSHLDRIVCCVDGYNQKSINIYRKGSNWKKVMGGINNIRDVETLCEKEMAVLMFKYNDNKEHIYRKIALENRFDKILFIMPIILIKKTLTKKEAEKFMSDNPIYQRYENVENIYHHKTKEQANVCHPQLIIASDGTVYPCCYDWKKEYPLGNILKDSLSDIKKSYSDFQISLENVEVKFCEKCFLPSIKPVAKMETFL